MPKEPPLIIQRKGVGMANRSIQIRITTESGYLYDIDEFDRKELEFCIAEGKRMLVALERKLEKLKSHRTG